MTATWREVHHQAERCKRLHGRAHQIPAAKLLFELIREQIEAVRAAQTKIRFVSESSIDGPADK